MWTSIVSADEFQMTREMISSDILVVDCRFDLMDPEAGRRRFQEGHLPGAIFADLNRDLSSPKSPGSGRHPLPSREALCALFSSWGISPGTQVVAYDDTDHSGAARLWWLLHYSGHARCAVLDGGFAAWKAHGFPVETGESRVKREAHAFQPHWHESWLIRVEEVPSALRLIDSRDPKRYRGEVEPVDPVAGHIPGARNLFFKDHLAENGRFRPRSEVSEKLQGIFDGVAPQETAFYCGSGVTACVNLLAMAYAGLPMGRLYAGSWSEWCQDRTRAVAQA